MPLPPAVTQWKVTQFPPRERGSGATAPGKGRGLAFCMVFPGGGVHSLRFGNQAKGKWRGGSVIQLHLLWGIGQACEGCILAASKRQADSKRKGRVSGQARQLPPTGNPGRVEWQRGFLALLGEWVGGCPCSMTCHLWSLQPFLGEFTVALTLTSHFPEVDGMGHCSVKQ